MSFQIMLVHKKQARMIHIYAASYARIGFQFRPYLLHFFGGMNTFNHQNAFLRQTRQQKIRELPNFVRRINGMDIYHIYVLARVYI